MSDSRDQCPKYSGTLIYSLLTFTEVKNNFPKIRNFADIKNYKSINSINPSFMPKICRLRVTYRALRSQYRLIILIFLKAIKLALVVKA